ncbi:hypothetical protein CEUSTIGMA_g69.t1 [Chlamydomonas eustigma]|uniref:RAP domain-containing protein n=1 Tax=Chlamydomonas eustigma TaxID=1157962 RepID=A0A250WP64_9CHLO|nr:hypothetical protein CEUSTIGMA_g69.t1 [Chlamydomonas eustigma]|eukprot:GAX72613.1 hypothetical protein CEUSTIGMA_g69.t1 [Chlamydomonas eustigma]
MISVQLPAARKCYKISERHRAVLKEASRCHSSPLQVHRPPSVQHSGAKQRLLSRRRASTFDLPTSPDMHWNALPRRPLNSAPVDSPLLNKYIKQCRTWQDMYELIQRHGSCFNFVHVAAAVTHLSQLKSRAEEAAALADRSARKSMLSSSTALTEAQRNAWPQLNPLHSPNILGPRHNHVSAALPDTTWSEHAGTFITEQLQVSTGPPSFPLLMQSLLNMVQDHMQQFGARQATNTLWALANLHDPALESASPTTYPLKCKTLAADMLPLTRVLLPWCEPQHLSNTIWAVATLGLDADDMWLEEFLVYSQRSLQGFEPQHLSNTLWALARLGIAPDDEWMREYLVHLDRSTPILSPLDVSHVLYSLASLGFEPEQAQTPLFEALQRRLLHVPIQSTSDKGFATTTPASRNKVGRAKASPQAISNSLWALATMSILPSKSWMSEVFDLVDARLNDFEPQALSSLMWSAATLGQPLPTSLTLKLFRETAPYLKTFPPRSLSNIIWALATSQQSSDTATSPSASSQAWMDAFLDAFQSQIHFMSDQAVSNTMWALTKLKVPVQPSLATLVVQHIHALDSREDGSTFRQEVGGGTGAEAGMSAQALSNCLWGLAKTGSLRLGEETTQVLINMVRKRLVNHMTAGSCGAGVTATSAKGKECFPGCTGFPHNALFKPVELASIWYSFAKLRIRPDPDMQALMLQATLAQVQQVGKGAVSQEGGASLVTRGAVSQVGGASLVTKAYLGPQDLANIAWALSSLELNPNPEWLIGFWTACCRQLSTFNTKDLAQLAYALPKIGWHAGQGGPWQALKLKMQQEAATRTSAAAVRTDAQVLPECRQAPAPSESVKLSKPSTWRSRKLFGEAEKVTTSAPKAVSTALRTAPQGFGWVVTKAGRSSARESGVKADAASVSTSNSAAAATAAAAAAPAPLPGLNLLLAEVARDLPRCSSQDIANLSWGLAQMGLNPPQGWLNMLSEVLIRRVDELEGRHVTTSVWALGKMGFNAKPRSLIQIEGSLYRRMPALKPRELAACAWAFAAMKYTPDLEWLDAFAAQCMLIAAEFTQQDWGVVVWSLASIAEAEQDAVIYLEDLFISPALEAQIHKFTPSTLAMLTVACGVLGTKSSRLMGRLLTAARPHMHVFKAQELSALVCTAARLQYAPDEAFVSSWLSTFESRMITMSGSIIAACGWALATIGVKPSPSWMQTYARVLAWRLDTLSAAEVSMVTWALGEWVPVLSTELVRQLGTRVGSCRMTYNKDVRRNLTWSMMKLKTKSKACAAKSGAGMKAGSEAASLKKADSVIMLEGGINLGVNAELDEVAL